MLSRDDHANAVVENLRAGRLDAREVILPPPAPLSEDDLPAWMRTTARPEPVGAAARPAKTFDEMTVGDLRGAVVDLHGELQRVRMERDGARLSLDAAHEARIKQSLELAEARARLDAAHAHIAVLERVAFTACGHADDLGEKLSEREEQIAARDEADAKVLRVEADWYRARRSVADLRGFVATMRAYHGVDVSAVVVLLDAIEDAARVHFAGSAR